MVEPVAEQIETEGAAEILVAGRPFAIGRTFLRDMERFTTGTVVGEQLAGKATLILHSPSDETVPVSAARELFAAAPHPKSFVSLDDADHLLGKREDASYVASVIDAWSRKYLS